VEAEALLRELRDILLIRRLTGLRVLNRYDIEGIDRGLFETCLPVVFYEPQTDDYRFDLPETGALPPLAVEALPGQFDVRAASCEECVQLISRGERPTVRTAKIYLFEGELDADDTLKIQKYLINPVESRKADLGERDTLKQRYDAPPDVEILAGFTAMDEKQAAAFVQNYGLAMDKDDLAFCMDYFRREGRDPSLRIGP
jgi:phosphoribosylformylglycinamidine synthase